MPAIFPFQTTSQLLMWKGLSGQPITQTNHSPGRGRGSRGARGEERGSIGTDHSLRCRMKGLTGETATVCRESLWPAGGGGERALLGTWAQAGWTGTWLAPGEPQGAGCSHPAGRQTRAVGLTEKFQGHSCFPDKQSSAGISWQRQPLCGSLGPPVRWKMLSRNPVIHLPLWRGTSAG